ncbi:MAG: rod shape-determining protein RodA [Bacteroidetes bacterium]|nr:rod shape-determining protein RodA [Bacteroidota bacterium]
MKIDYKIQDKFDFGLFLPVLSLIIIGLLAIYSSTVNHPTAIGNFERQLSWTFISILVFFIVYFLPQQTFRYAAIFSYALSIFFLIVVLIMGKTVYGAKSWLAFGPFGFQPSEFAKIGVILFMAYWFTKSERNINNPLEIGYALTIGFLPVLLILLEPDMGTAIVYIILTLAMIFWSGISIFGMFVVVSPGVAAFASLFGLHVFIIALVFVVILLFIFKRNLYTNATVFVLNLAAGYFFDYAFNMLKPHQQSRITSFIDPSSDPLGAGYNALQAKVAIGSGGFWGKGFMEGNQTQLRFIPEQWTDFIYCVIGEEFGFLGSIIVVILFGIVLVKILNYASISKSKSNSLILIGILAVLFSHFAINIGMNVGITPVIGLPLPFLSYGGSSLLMNMVLIGITMNIYKNRKLHT